ncbi:Stp1/IreP family PP2C-type Ser/Thr phosphatase [Alkalihalobacillus sp. 1P02AB]|uniref:Stp1/IreP family PP2C-type Ser/Thr phosphatase n=1 Tax=Alkalihalobacillus sp. 1P02AB TaxID=3132260 RepID=UPI0039A65E06
MEIAYTFKTDTGQIRTHNEDNGGVFVNDTGVLALVADGMGGHLAGDVASLMTKDFFQLAWQNSPLLTSINETEDWLKEQVQAVNQKLYKHSENHKECHGMGTTIVAAICTKEFVTIGHIGDSRIYIKNEFGFSAKTNDHSLVQELVRSGQITEEEAENHPRRNVVLKALGTEKEISADVRSMFIEGDELILLCSDGLSDKVSTTDITKIIDEKMSLEQKANALVDLANERGGEDNITVALVEYPLNKEESGR